MARVTFIIGNGLDLSMGLKTAYRDFYDHVTKKNLHSKNRIYKTIQESPENWADFELALGQYTRYIEKLAEKDRKNESVDLHEELEELRDDLADYLDEQEKLIDPLVDSVSFTNNAFYEELYLGQRDKIRNQLLQKGVSYHFISLNYTNTLEKILSNGNHRTLTAQGISLETPHHIHGDLLTNLTLGVSDETQLSSSVSGAEKDDLIKPSLIYSMNDGRIDTMRQIINASSVIVFFGTSIGETDKYIWELVIKWLAESADRYIVVHKHDVNYLDSTKRSSRRQKQFTSSVQDRLLRYSALDGDGIAELKDQIFVIHNTKRLFTTK